MNAQSPFVVEISSRYFVEDALLRLSTLKGVMLLESSSTADDRGRYSYLMAMPGAEWSVKKLADAQQIWHDFRESCRQYQCTHIAELPPFQGGAAGFLSYEFGNLFEPIVNPKLTGMDIPLAVLRIYYWVLAWDHRENKCWYIDHRLDQAHSNWEMIRELLERSTTSCSETLSEQAPDPNNQASLITLSGSSEIFKPEINLHELFELSQQCQRQIFSNFSPQAYLAAINRTVEYINAGDIFQANLTQQLFAPWEHSGLELYLKLRICNPAPFAGYFAHDSFQIISASPERFIHLENNIASTRPIKGTRRRLVSPEANLFQGQELASSSKDRAENVMIVDLLRNDFSRVCKPGTVCVPKLCEVETFSTVQHLVSEIKGELLPGQDYWDLLQVTLPGGSISGAPKIRARQIIAELEQIQRGAYCGNLFYHSFSGRADSNILIRTFTLSKGCLQFPVGGGIVVNSTPTEEYQETLHKAAGLLAALTVNP